MSTQRRGGSTVLVVAIVVTVAALGMGALWVSKAASTTETTGVKDEFVVQRGSFEITVPASGELAAKNQLEIRNKLEYRATITEMIEEGTVVKQGDVLFRLAADEVENKIQDAEDAVNTATSALTAAESNLVIKISSSESEIAQADLDVMLAELALKAWEEGEVVSKRKELALEVETAQMDYDRLFNKYEESKKLVAQEFISQDEFKSDEISMVKAKARLQQANLDIDVYENYQYKKEEAQKHSDVDQAKSERERVAERHKAQLETASADVTNKTRHLRSQTERLADLREQLEYCTVTAPADGLVVYASSLERHRWSWSNRGDLQVGSELRKNELVMALPDTTEMNAEVKVNESLTGLIEPGQGTIITMDAVQDATLDGEVLSIGVLAESGGWRDPNRRDYTVKIRLTDGNELGLKPSMRCKAEIYVGEVTDALYVPLQAIFREGPVAYVYVPEGYGYGQRQVALGQASGLNVEIVGGLEEGAVVLLRQPEPREITSRLELDETNGRGRPGMDPEGRGKGDWSGHSATARDSAKGKKGKRPEGTAKRTEGGKGHKGT